MNRVTKLVHFIHVKDNMTVDQSGQTYIREILRLYGVLKIIVLDGDMRFVSTFWHSLQRSMGNKLVFSTVYHL